MKFIAFYDGDEIPTELKDMANNGHTIYTQYKGAFVQLLSNNEATKVDRLAIESLVNQLNLSDEADVLIEKKDGSTVNYDEVFSQYDAVLEKLCSRMSDIETSVEEIENALRKPIL